MIRLTFPDNSSREFSPGVTGREVAEGISKSLAKKAVAMALDGELADLADPITQDAKIEIVTRDDPRALGLIRHDAAHVMAEAVQELYPGTQVTIGPVIDNGFFYDFHRNQPFTTEDLPAIEAKMREIVRRNAPFTKEVWPRDKARQVFRDKGEMFKVELVDAIPEGQDLKIYRQGEWFDLCRGPHMTSTGQIGEAFKLTKVAGAYWRGDSTKPMLTRIYGTAFAAEGRARRLSPHARGGGEARPPPARPRDGPLPFPGGRARHRVLARQGLDDVPGDRRLHAPPAEGGYDEVNAPQLLDKSLWETSGHWNWFRENMFMAKSAGDETGDERVFAIKPMNCPGHIQIFKHGLKSYRDLPLRMAEFGIVHRYEPSGALHGLMRVRGFTQDDAHIFCTEDQMAAECLRINDLILSTYRDFGFEEFVVKLSTRPDKRVGSDAAWDRAEAIMGDVLKQIAERSGGKIKTGINPGEGAFYGPKFEYVLRDAIGRDWQCGTTQVDFNLPERFGAFYVDSDGEKKTPVMIHRAIVGSLERFLGVVLEHYAGHLPLWLAPVQVGGGDHHLRRRRLCARRSRPGSRPRVSGSTSTSATRRSTTRSASTRWPRSRSFSSAASARRRRRRSTSAASARRDQTSMSLDAAIAALADEATPPDLRRQRG